MMSFIFDKYLFVSKQGWVKVWHFQEAIYFVKTNLTQLNRFETNVLSHTLYFCLTLVDANIVVHQVVNGQHY